MSSSQIKPLNAAKEEKHIHAEFSSRFQEIDQPNARDAVDLRVGSESSPPTGDGLDGFPNPHLAPQNLNF